VRHECALPEPFAQGNDYQEDDGHRAPVPASGEAGSWALRSVDEIYRLKSQLGIQEFAGQNVVVVGALDAKTNTIDNASITKRLVPLK
jgi:hypothetical protein